MNNQGYIKLHRKIMDNKIFFMPEHLQLFLYLVLKANHKKTRCYGVDINRGQLITGRKMLSAELRVNEGTAYKRLLWLQRNELIFINSNNKFTIVTVCNYDTYNLVITTKGQQGNNEVTTKGQRGNTNNNNKNDKNEKNDNISGIEFDFFWNQYHAITNQPKTDKSPAVKKWIRLNKEERSKAMDNIRPYYESLRDNSHCKKCRTYLEDKNFNDEFKPPKPLNLNRSVLDD